MKEITLYAPIEAMQTLRQIIEQYVEAAYPPGGSECAQSAREALQMVGQRIQDEYDTNNSSVTISRRAKAHIKSALQYYSQPAASAINERTDPVIMQKSIQLLQCLDGGVLSLEDWQS